MQIYGLKTCGGVNPMALTDAEIYFSFKVVGGDEENFSFKVAVANSLESLKKGNYNVWLSEEKDINSILRIDYTGEKLLPDIDYYWQVISGEYKSDIAKFGIGLKTKDWQADFIERGCISDVAPLFIKGFELNKKVVGAKLYITGLGYFEAFINGERVTSDGYVPQVSDYEDRELNGLFETYPLNTRKSVYYLCYDVAPLLEKQNTLAVLVGNGWYKNHEKPNEGNFYYGEPKCIFELHLKFEDGSTKKILSGEDVSVADGNILKNTLYTGEVVDFNKPLLLDLRDYKTELPFAVKCKMNTELIYQKEPSDCAGEIFEPIEVIEKENYTLFDFGQNHSGVLRLSVKGKKGERIKFVFGENKTDGGDIDVYSSSWGGHVQTDEIILSGKEDIYKSRFTVHGYRYCKAEYAVKPKFEKMQSLFIYTNVHKDGFFECDDKLINRILKNYEYTHLSNLHGNVPTDCPHRERRGFLGDGHAAMRSAMYAFDMQLTYKKWIKDIKDAQSITGFMPHTAPFAAGGGGAGFGSGCIIIPYKFYKFYGDKSVLESNYDGMLNYIKYLYSRQDGDGIIVREEKGWCIGEWFNPTLIDLDIPFANTYFFILSIKLVIEITKILNRENELGWLNGLLTWVSGNFMKRYYDYKTHKFCNGGKGAVFFGLDLELLDKEEAELCLNEGIRHIVEDLNYHLETGIFGTPLMFKILTEYGRRDILFEILTKTDYPSYGYMIERGATTLWEGFEERDGPSYLLRDGYPQTGYGVSHNHPMLGSICEWMWTSLAGLDINDLGVTKVIKINPYISGKLSFAKGEKETVFGYAAVSWVKMDGVCKMEVVIPLNCKGEIKLEGVKNITVNNEVYKDNAFTLSSGRYSIEMDIPNTVGG